MALDTRLPLAVSTPDMASTFQNSLLTGQQFAQNRELQPLRNRLLTAQAGQAEQQLSEQERLNQLGRMASDALQIKPILESGDIIGTIQALDQRIAGINDRRGDPRHTLKIRQGLANGTITPQQAIGELNTVIDAAQRFGVIGRTGTADIQSFEAKARAAGLQPGTPEYERAAKVDLGLSPRAGTVTGEERTATTPGLTESVAGSRAVIAGAESRAKEEGKLGAQAELLPSIRASIKEAETAAKDRGETLSAYNRAKAALPGLTEVVGKLKTLSDVATYTIGGKAFDEVVKQLGFGSTKGATARVKMESIVDNQVLPLLRDTFGAAFTAAEGERLRNTLLDPDSAPEAKKASLDAFLEQKMRNLETQEKEILDGNRPASIPESIWNAMTPEEKAAFQ